MKRFDLDLFCGTDASTHYADRISAVDFAYLTGVGTV